MKQIKFLGAAGDVTGSSYLATTGSGLDILIDMGLFQGPENIEKQNYLPLSFNPSYVGAVFLTHAHLDHCGRLPLLLKNGFRGNIFMTQPTKDLVALQLQDSARIARNDKDNIALFSGRDVDRMLKQIQAVAYNQLFDFGGLKITFRDAGHILGSASIEIEDTTANSEVRKVIFSGDLGNSPSDLLQPTYLFSDADAVIMETTYGDRLHPADDYHQHIQKEINTIEQTGGTLLVPAFSLDRTQNLLHTINHLKTAGKIQGRTPVYLDSPMAIKATTIYKRYKGLYSEELSAHAKHEDPFNFPGLVIVEKGWQSQEIVDDVRAKVIIAGNGMMEGGRIMGHAVTFLPRESTRLLITGYQGEETLGREIQDGATSMSIEGVNVPIKATITDASTMSAHADQNQLLKWIKNIQGVKKLMLTHGEDPSRQAFARKVKEEIGIQNVSLPHLDEVTLLTI